MAGMFEHTFQQALFAVGAVLALVGAIFALAASPAGGDAGIAELISYGFASFFLALFSGALFGVGVAMASDALILGMRGNKSHVAACALFSILSLLIAASSVAKADSTSFYMLALFFAGLSASGAFMLSAAVFGLSALFKAYVSKAAPADGGEGGGKDGGLRQKTARREKRL